jgi:peptidoglycan/LPS O-acetylase OafA/YrhL
VEVLYLASYRPVFGAAIAYVMLFSLSSHPVGRRLGRMLSARWLFPIGQLSYVAYLVNPMVTTLVHRWLARWVTESGTPPMLAFIPADVALTFISAAALHLCVERPALELRPKASSSQNQAVAPTVSVF